MKPAELFDMRGALLADIARHRLTPGARALATELAYRGTCAKDCACKRYPRRALAGDMLPLVIRCATQLTRQGKVLDADFMDVIQAGCFGLMQAIETWDPNHERGATLATWSAWYIKREMLRENERTPLVANATGIDTYVEEKDGFGMDYAFSDEPDPAHKVEHEKISSWLEAIAGEHLSPAEYRVITGLYFRDLSTRTIGAEMGISHTGVARIHAEALDKIRAALQNR